MHAVLRQSSHVLLTHMKHTVLVALKHLTLWVINQSIILSSYIKKVTQVTRWGYIKKVVQKGSIVMRAEDFFKVVSHAHPPCALIFMRALIQHTPVVCFSMMKYNYIVVSSIPIISFRNCLNITPCKGLL